MPKVIQISVGHSRSSAEQFGSTVTTALLDDGRIFESLNGESWSQLIDGPWTSEQPADPPADREQVRREAFEEAATFVEALQSDIDKASWNVAMAGIAIELRRLAADGRSGKS